MLNNVELWHKKVKKQTKLKKWQALLLMFLMKRASVRFSF